MAVFVTLASQMIEMLTNRDFALGLAEVAKAEIDRFDWNKIALSTIEIYLKGLNKEQQKWLKEVAVSTEKDTLPR